MGRVRFLFVGDAASVPFNSACPARTWEANCFPYKNYQSLRKLWQFAPLHCALAFFTAEMRLSQQFAQIFVAGPIFHQHWKDTAVFHRKFGADDRTHAMFASRDRKS